MNPHNEMTLRAVHERKHSPCPECGSRVHACVTGDYRPVGWRVGCVNHACDYAHTEAGYDTEAKAWAAHEAWCREMTEEDEG